MRVITHLGFGEIDTPILPSRLLTDPIEVTLDQPFLGDKIQPFHSGEIFGFGDWAVIRILKVSGVGILSNLQFFATEGEASSYLLSPAPPDETRFLVNLVSGSAESDQPLGFGTEEFLIVRPWVDRWALERSEMFDDRSAVVERFTKEKSELSGSTGISATAAFSTHKGKMLWFYISIAPPQGIIFERLFQNDLLL